MFAITRRFASALRTPSIFYRFSQQNKSQWKVSTPEEQKASQFIAKNVGLSRFLTRTYNTTAVSVIGALSAAYAGASIPMLAMNPMATSIGGIIAMLIGLISVQYMKAKPVTEYQVGVPIHRTENSPLRIGLYTMGVLGLGLSSSPLFAAASFLNPSILTNAIGLTCGIFGGASLMAYNMPKDKMLSYGRLMMGSLFGLIGLQLVGLASAWIMGPNMLSLMLFRADTYLGILLFSGFIAYDTHVAIKQYENGYADHLGVSVQFLLDFWNIMVRIIQIFMSRE